MKLKKLLAIMLVVAALFVCSITASASVNGKGYQDGHFVYYVDGEIVKNGWIETEYEGTFYADENGALYANGVYEIGGNSYAFSEDAVLYAGYVFQLGEDYYYADANGVIAKNQWIETENNWEYNVSAWYYAGPDGKLLKGMQDIGGKRYYFEDNPSYSGQCVMLENTAFQLYDEAADEWYNYYAKEDGALARNEWGKTYEGEDAYYGDDYLRVDKQTLSIGGKLYLFGYNGELIKDQVYSIWNQELQEEYYYHALSDGTVVANQWEQTYLADGDDTWFYYGADGKRYFDGVYKIGSNYYYFEDDGRMKADTEVAEEYWDEELFEWIITGAYRARPSGALYVNEWYQDENGIWYYYGAEGKAAQGKTVVNGVTYCFSEWGRMIKDQAEIVRVNGVNKYYIVDANGVIYEGENNRWIQAGKNWYYVQDEQFCYAGIYTINGKKYGFDYSCRMYDNTIFEIYDNGNWSAFYAKAGGSLAQNEVIYISDSNYRGYHLFGPDGAKPHQTGFYELNGKYYYLNGYWEHSTIATNQIIESDQHGAYKFNEKGEGTKLSDGWHYNDTRTDDQYYIYVRGSMLLKDGIYEIGGKRYAFNYEGAMLENRIYSDSLTEKYYYITPVSEGGHICSEKNVWKKINGRYIYLSSDSSLHEGWLNDKYYMTPYMTYCTYFIDDNAQVYIANTQGHSQKLTTTGFLNLYGAKGYLRNGKVVTSEWIKLDGIWYYANENGTICSNGSYKIDGNYYCFDADGKMFVGGWITLNNGATWYYANSGGVLKTGYDSATGYVFTSTGRLTNDAVVLMDGIWYVSDKDGKLVGKIDKIGWNQVGSDWFYVDSYEESDGYIYKYLLESDGYLIGDKCYGFDSDGRMITNQIRYGHYFSNSGSALTGWQKLDGKWYYGDPEDYGRLYTDGIYEIDGKRYVFNEDGILREGETFFYWYSDTVITVDSSGAIINEAKPNGWYYDERWGYGECYYYENGNVYTGWVGNYYVDGGIMAIDSIIEDTNTGKLYYIGKKGLKAGAGWSKMYGDWIYAQADGSLVCDQWLKLGSTWYYFDGPYMVANGIYTIDGEEHKFAENGAWLGEYKSETVKADNGCKDGWQKIDGKWYFSMAGRFVSGEYLYIDGKWYFFYDNGEMAANCFMLYTGDDLVYFTASGAQADYTGWQKMNGKWVYFNNDHTIDLGWIKDGNEYYYQTCNLDYTDEKGEVISNVGIITGYEVINGKLCYFNNSGLYVKAITAKGWHKVNNRWHYVDANGEVVSGESMYKIDNAYYAFDYDGNMIANDVYGEYYDDQRYYDASGALVTKEGWYQIGSEWIYVTKSGTVATDGVYKIGGKAYYFSGCFWVK